MPVAERRRFVSAGVVYGMFSVSDSDDGALAFRGGAGAKLLPTLFDADGRVLESFDLRGRGESASIAGRVAHSRCGRPAGRPEHLDDRPRAQGERRD